MTHADAPPAVTVGVVLAAPRPDDLADWLADGAAFEAAGADALWVAPEADGVLDPLVLTAALAVLTSRALLLASLPAAWDGPTLVTVGRLSRGRLRFLADDATAYPDDEVVRAGGFGRLRRGADDGDALEDASDPAPARRWLVAASPEDRDAWRATIVDAAERGYTRVLVPANPRLLDILRNPHEPDERRDLQLAQG